MRYFKIKNHSKLSELYLLLEGKYTYVYQIKMSIMVGIMWMGILIGDVMVQFVAEGNSIVSIDGS